MDLISTVLKQIFSPVINLLKQEGLWGYLVYIYDFIAGIFNKIFQWINLDINLNWKTILNLFIAFVKLFISIFVAVIDILKEIFNFIVDLLT